VIPQAELHTSAASAIASRNGEGWATLVVRGKSLGPFSICRYVFYEAAQDRMRGELQLAPWMGAS
jgi:hypothetical protein